MFELLKKVTKNQGSQVNLWSACILAHLCQVCLIKNRSVITMDEVLALTVPYFSTVKSLDIWNKSSLYLTAEKENPSSLCGLWAR